MIVQAVLVDHWPVGVAYADADYADAFTAPTLDALMRTPEDWARRVLEGASRPMRLFLRVGWRYFLGFPLVGADGVLGWPVTAEADGWVALEQCSWLFGVVLLMRASDGELVWATRVKYRSPVSRVAWAVVRPIHHRFAPRALRRAVGWGARLPGYPCAERLQEAQ